MKKYLSPASTIIICVVLIAIYFILIHPISSFIGMLLYLLGGWLIPSIVNLLITYVIVSSLRINKVYKIVLFIPFSFLLGMNTHLFYLRNINPEQVELHVFQPLRSSTLLNNVNGKSLITSILWDKNEADVYAYPLEIATLGGDEGCMCSYFTTLHYLYNHTMPLADKDVSSNLYKLFAPGNLMLTSTSDPNDADYFLHIKKQPIGMTKSKLTIEIRDKFNGYATISGIYPKGIIIDDLKNYRLYEDPYFWHKSFNSLLHNNFWNTCITSIVSPRTKSLFDSLKYSDLEKLFAKSMPH